jgi:hypothetical protein
MWFLTGTPREILTVQLFKFRGLILIPRLICGFCLLFVVLPHIDPLKKNYHSASVWNKTHQKGAMLFKLAGVVSMIGIRAGI